MSIANKKHKIAVVGSGVSGLSCAWLLSKNNDVTLFEKSDYIGGHAKTITINHGLKNYDLDVGFIVYNNINYPNFVKLLNHFSLPTQKSNMSFSVSESKGRYEYASTLPLGPFIQPSNIIKKRFIEMIFDIPKFYRFAKKYDFKLNKKSFNLLEFLELGNFSKYYCYDHLFPMASAIWSQPIKKVMEFDAESFVNFYNSHGLLSFLNRPKWRTIKGGSKLYVNKLLENFSGQVILNSNILSVSRQNNRIKVITEKQNLNFDHIIFAIHPENIVKILEDASFNELNIYKKFEAEENYCYIHSDVNLMPKRKSAWTSWNYFSEKNRDINTKVYVTYWLNRLQNINGENNFFLSLNPLKPPSDKKIYKQFKYFHPIYNIETVKSQFQIDKIQGEKNTWYCGAWNGFGFHEDGLSSGIEIAKKFGCQVPWKEN